MLLCFLVLSTVLGGLPAWADGTVGSFEVDGDSADSPAGEPIDWNTPPPNVANILDLSKSKNDDSFGQGSKELEPGGWVCTTGGIPGKDDLKGGKIAIREVAGKQFLYGNWLRLTTNGDAHIDYEFNQSNSPGPCPGTLARTNNDRLITFDTENGGRTIFVRAWRWEFNPGSTTSGTFIEITSATEHVTFDGAVNISPSLSDPNVPAGAFGEFSLNLTDTTGPITCGQFAGVHLKTRASTAINSALKDRTLPVPIPGIECPQPALNIAKSGVQNADGTLTFTITYSNSGSAAANPVTIKDTLPSGTTFSSCSDGCTQVGNTVTWSVGPLPPNSGNRTVTLTLTITSFPASCVICNVARISSPQFQGNAEVSSTPACVTVNPAPNPAGAVASGNATGIYAAAPHLISTTTIGTSSSSQTGPGTTADDDTFLNVNEGAPVVTAALINTHASSSVSAAGAVQESSAETVTVNVLGGLITASKVLGVARAEASGATATYGTSSGPLASGFVDLKIDLDGSAGSDPAVAYDNVAPNTSIDVSDVFGAGSYIRLFWISGNQAGLAATPLPARYTSDITVRMIDVHLADSDPSAGGNQPADVRVSEAVAHAEFRQTPLCQPAPIQSVLADATIARVERTPALDPTVVGYVFIPSSGGTSSQHANSAFVEGVLTSGAADSFATGSLTSSASTSSAYAVVKNVCLVPSASGCAVSATLVKGATSSSATAGARSSGPADSKLVGVQVLGVALPDGVAPNTPIIVPGLGTLWLNRQICNLGTAPAPPAPAGPCSSGGSTEITVRAMELEVTEANPVLPVGSIVVVAEAHSGATYI